jgi:transposase, IS6 family
VAFHDTEQYANNRVGVRPRQAQSQTPTQRGLKRDHSARVITRRHALMQNLRRGGYELGVDARSHRRIQTAFTELAQTI